MKAIGIKVEFDSEGELVAIENRPSLFHETDGETRYKCFDGKLWRVKARPGSNMMDLERIPSRSELQAWLRKHGKHASHNCPATMSTANDCECGLFKMIELKPGEHGTTLV